MVSFGHSSQQSKSEPVTWQKLLHPTQKAAVAAAGPLIEKYGMQGLQGFGISPEERSRQREMLSGNLADYAGGMREGVRMRAGELGQRGGVVEGGMKNIDAAKLMSYAEGLRSIEDMNQQLAQQKVANLLSFITWNPPVATQSSASGGGFTMGLGK